MTKISLLCFYLQQIFTVDLSDVLYVVLCVMLLICLGRLLFIDAEFRTLKMKAEDSAGRQHAITIKLKSKVKPGVKPCFISYFGKTLFHCVLLVTRYMYSVLDINTRQYGWISAIVCNTDIPTSHFSRLNYIYIYNISLSHLSMKS